MKMLDRLDQGRAPVVYGDGSQSYDFIYETDVARANVCALKSEECGFYNIGSGESTSIRRLAELLIELTGSSCEIHFEPQGPTFVTNRVGSVEKALSRLGFKAQVGLIEGLQELIEWRSHHANEVDKRRAVGSESYQAG